MDAFSNWVFDNGRVGAVVMLVLGVALLGATFVDYRASGGFFIAFPVAGTLLLFLGVGLFVSARGKSTFEPAPARPLDPALWADLASTPKPFQLCMACRKVTAFSPCMHCDKASDVMTIDTDEDLALAKTAME
jgi:hypothetical protein